RAVERVAFADGEENPGPAKQRWYLGGTPLHHGTCRGNQRSNPQFEIRSCELIGACFCGSRRAPSVALAVSPPRLSRRQAATCGASRLRTEVFTALSTDCFVPVNL